MKSGSSSNSSRGFAAFCRVEYPLFIGIVVAAVFLALESKVLEDLAHPAALTAVFVVLLGAVLWSAISAVHHADCLAIKFGEPYGTLILTLSVISIEVMMISGAMLHGENNPTLARDTMFGVVMIALNGLVGFSLLLGGLRHREQNYNLQGAGAYLNTIMALVVLELVMPNFTTSMAGPRFTIVQEIFLITVSVLLYAVFLFIQTGRHRGYFKDAVDENNSDTHGSKVNLRSTGFHAVMLLLYLIVVIVLAEKFAIPLDNSIERFGAPQAFGGAIIAALVLSPEALAAIKAATRNRLQRSVNILHGSVLASIGLTIPAVLIIGIVTHRPVTLGVEGGNLPLLILTMAASIVTFGSGKTNILQGCIHLLLFAVFLMLIFSP
ncbi:MAG TPA: calcium:proton antiporter [Chthoniobacterales bacterium]|nr:calcium:proton antiporter [Chthoniobacterales bacterium]